MELRDDYEKLYTRYFWIGLIGLLFGSVITLVLFLSFRVILDNPELVFQYLTATNPDDIPERIHFYSIFASLIVNIFLVFIFSLLLIKPLKIDFTKFKSKLLKNVLIIVVGTVLMKVAFIGVSYIYEKLLGIDLSTSSANQELIENAIASPLAWAVFIATVIVAPILEEMIFRKCLFGMLEKNLNVSRIVAIIISTLLFSFVHVMDMDSLQFIFLYIPYALVLSIAYSMSDNNYYVPFGMHFMSNLLGFFGI
ncbi:MAG: CPBP family intramembrane metalloprotease [Bacilli bacterium]|nr:CPBP family intramembrane metalloprotease [Bacilli bacterium]